MFWFLVHGADFGGCRWCLLGVSGVLGVWVFRAAAGFPVVFVLVRGWYNIDSSVWLMGFGEGRWICVLVVVCG